MKKVFYVVAIIVAVSALGFFFLRGRENGVKFRTEKAGRGDIVASVTATGTVNAVTTVNIGTQVSGTIKNLFVDFNSKVRKGQIIARIDPEFFASQVAQSRANLMAAQAGVEKAQASLDDAKRVLDRNRELFAKNYIARSDLDTSDANYQIARAQLGSARAQVGQAQASLSNAEINLRYTQILSPVDGIVVSRNVDVGQTVAASFQTPTLFNIAQDLTKMQIDSNVAEADIGKIVIGQPVEFRVDAYPDIIFNGKVSEIRNAPITVQNVVTYDVVVKVDNSDLKLKPGMTANVTIITKTVNNALRIPNAVLRFRMPGAEQKAGQSRGAEVRDKGAKGVTVWVIENNASAKKQIVAGISDGNYTEVVSGDIREGMELIVEALSKGREPQRSGPRMF